MLHVLAPLNLERQELQGHNHGQMVRWVIQSVLYRTTEAQFAHVLELSSCHRLATNPVGLHFTCVAGLTIVRGQVHQAEVDQLLQDL